MCTIFGIIGEHNANLAHSALSRLSHCESDYCGVIEKRGLFFVHRHLSKAITDKNIILSFNGKISNIKELKRELNFAFETESDSEVIIAAYLKWGETFVLHIRGVFTIALLDGERLYLFRDRLGNKPLFYLEGKSFIFASALRALIPFLGRKEMDEDALLSYLTYLAPTPPFTFFKGIKKLAAGEYLTLENGIAHTKRYYDILQAEPNAITNKQTALAKIESALTESMELHLSAGAAVLLSGGIDSATISYYAQAMGLRLPTYTLGYKEFAKYDERANAAESALFLGVENRGVEIDEVSFMEASERVFESMDEPLNDPAAIPLYLLFERIKKDGYGVLISGEGSDEIFLGYRQYFEYLDIEKAATLSHKNWLKKYFRANFSMNREWEWYKRVFDETLLFRTSGEKFSDLQKNALMRRNVRDNESLKYIAAYRERFTNSTFSDESFWYSYIDLNLFQAEHFLAKLNRVSMAHSIESRTPFLDHKLVETLFCIEPKLRYEEGVTKSLLKEIMQKRLSPSTLTRKKKGFANPYMEYLIHSKKIALIKEVNTQTGIFHADKLDEYINRASSGSFKQHIWGLYVLSHWIKKELL